MARYPEHFALEEERAAIAVHIARFMHARGIRRREGATLVAAAVEHAQHVAVGGFARAARD
jgi:hypothetical protein